MSGRDRALELVLRVCEDFMEHGQIYAEPPGDTYFTPKGRRRRPLETRDPGKILAAVRLLRSATPPDSPTPSPSGPHE